MKNDGVRNKEIFTYEDYVKNSKFLSDKVHHRSTAVETGPSFSLSHISNNINHQKTRGNHLKSSLDAGYADRKEGNPRDFFTDRLEDSAKFKRVNEEKPFLTHQDSMSYGSEYEERRQRIENKYQK